mgnify:CR=1 FL=1
MIEKDIGRIMGYNGDYYIPFFFNDENDKYTIEWYENGISESSIPSFDITPFIYKPTFDNNSIIFKLFNKENSEDKDIPPCYIKGDPGPNQIIIKTKDWTFEQLQEYGEKNPSIIYNIFSNNEDNYDTYIYDEELDDFIEFNSTINFDQYYNAKEISRKIGFDNQNKWNELIII